MRNRPLMEVLQLFRGEIRQALTPGTAASTQDNDCILIENKQKWLANEYSWPFLRVEATVTFAPMQRFGVIPTTITWDRPWKLETLFNTIWYPIRQGISSEEYNALSSAGDNRPVQPQDPIARWRIKPGDETQFEVWPLPVSQQIIKFTANRDVGSLRNTSLGGFQFNMTAPVELDDLVLVYFCAAQWYTGKEGFQDTVKMYIQMGLDRLMKLKAIGPNSEDKLVIGNNLLDEHGGRLPHYMRPRIQ